ncbi:hypothetical protein HAX54_013741 [Datura stramonium]|uniref:Uncharacterized protein n=1 Tax=Datura stramonium TaxID=4076 RepID=A0ABS8Y3X6_DATST|nr:hypothetical protein [Datura stramonium]
MREALALQCYQKRDAVGDWAQCQARGALPSARRGSMFGAIPGARHRPPSATVCATRP